MKNIANRTKQFVKVNARPLYYYSTGIAVGVAAASLHYRPQVAAMQMDAVNTLIKACEKEGLNLFALNAEQTAKWINLVNQ